MKKKILIGASITILVFIILATAFVGNYFYDLALNPKSSKTAVFGEDEPQTEEQILKQMQKVSWLKENSEEVMIKSQDNLSLHGYEIRQSTATNKWAIVIHGYMSEAEMMIGPAKHFFDKGYQVLVVDLRGHGKSEGTYIGMGWHDRLDILEWIEYLTKKQSDCQIVLYGVSMGAATVMMTTGEELSSNVKCAIEDCGYSSVWDEFAMQLQDLFHLPTFPVLNAANLVARIRAGYNFKEASSIEQLKKSKTPTLFIHGNKDTFVPYRMLDIVYEAAKCEKQKLVIEGAEHAEAAQVNEELYWKTIEEFIEKYVQ